MRIISCVRTLPSCFDSCFAYSHHRRRDVVWWKRKLWRRETAQPQPAPVSELWLCHTKRWASSTYGYSQFFTISFTRSIAITIIDISRGSGCCRETPEAVRWPTTDETEMTRRKWTRDSIVGQRDRSQRGAGWVNVTTFFRSCVFILFANRVRRWCKSLWCL